MPISPMDEFLAHQTPETIDHVATSDKNFYDRYYFNCHPSSDELFLVTGLGQYPNLGVTDAFVAISHGTTQYVVRASRELGSDRLDTSAGPFRVEVIEGLQKLRVVCEPNEWGVAFDMTFVGQVPAQEEPRTLRRSHGRVTADTTRYAQVGSWEGRLEVAGQTFDVVPERWKGARDRSWGIRPVGEAEAPGIRLKDLQAGTAGFYHHWCPLQFEDSMLKVQLDEHHDGTPVLEEAVRVWNHGVDEAPVDLGKPKIAITYLPGTREIDHADITLTHPGGRELTIRSQPLRTVYLRAGTGYMPHDGWGHGYYQGALKVEGMRFALGTQAERSEWAGLNETLSRFELDTGEVCYAMHENMIMGTYLPDGFDSPGAVAPQR